MTVSGNCRDRTTHHELRFRRRLILPRGSRRLARSARLSDLKRGGDYRQTGGHAPLDFGGRLPEYERGLRLRVFGGCLECARSFARRLGGAASGILPREPRCLCQMRPGGLKSQKLELERGRRHPNQPPG
jgi:hypothetical protein